MNRVAIYARTSTGKQDVDLQLEELREYAKLRKLKIVGEFIDEGVSSGKVQRPKLEELMTFTRRRKTVVILVWRFDRFARSTRELMAGLDEFRFLGVDCISLRESVTSTPAGRVLFTMIAAIAEFEREIIRERVKAGTEKAKRKGKRLGRPKRIVDVHRVKKLRAQGLSWSVISRKLKMPASTIRSRLAENPFEATPQIAPN
jgi:DNA invertase Pin-like site-specific DNA recombinase